MKTKDICFSSARDLSEAIHKRKLSVKEVVQAHLDQINKVNPKVNAIVSLNEELALKEAEIADKKLLSGEKVGPLHGLPLAIKDTEHAKGFPSTSGSLLFKDRIAEEDNLVAERLRAAGAIII